MRHTRAIDYMQRAIQLAHRAGPSVKSNPKVGCVIVANDRIIGEGTHEVFGQAHAEINAISDARSKGFEPGPDWEFYVTLEPCAHRGKTPSCAEKLIELKPALVCIGAEDLNPRVNGAGIKMLQNAGIRTELLPVGGLNELTEVFYVNLFQQRPFTVLKWAQTAAGYIGSTGQRLKISNPLTDMLVHQWRATSDAILIGGGTLTADDPQLNVRLVPGHDPLPVVITSRQALELAHYRLFANGRQPVLINPALFKNSEGIIDWSAILRHLYAQYHICRLLVEGGNKTLSSMLRQQCSDEIRIIINSDRNLKGDIPAPVYPPGLLTDRFRLMNDFIHIFKTDYHSFT